MESNQIKAVIFDVDGVLVESEKANFLSLAKALKENFDFALHEADDRNLGPIPSFVKLDKLKEKFNFTVSDEQRKKFLNDKFEFLIEEINRGNVKFNPHIFDVFSFVKSIGLKIAVVSNARSQYIITVLEKSNILQFVDVMIGNDSGLKPKPSPEMYNFAIHSLGVKPQQCIIFEDSEVGLLAAKSSGAIAVEVPNFLFLNREVVQNKVCTF